MLEPWVKGKTLLFVNKYVKLLENLIHDKINFIYKMLMVNMLLFLLVLGLSTFWDRCFWFCPYLINLSFGELDFVFCSYLVNLSFGVLAFVFALYGLTRFNVFALGFARI